MFGNKKFILFGVIPAVILVVIVIVLKFSNTSKVVNQKEVVVGDKIPEIKNTTVVDTSSDKELIYDSQEQDSVDKALNEERTNQTLGDVEKALNEQNSKPKSFSDIQGNSKSSSKKKKKTKKAQTFQAAQKQVVKEVVYVNAPKNEAPEEDVSGFGKSAVSDVKKSEVNGKVQNKNISATVDEYIPAYLESDYIVKNNSSDIVFILHQDWEIGGVKFKKMSVLYAFAQESNYYFDVYVRKIKNAADSKVYNVSLQLYDEYYSIGIKFEGGVNKAVQGTGRSTINDGASSVPYTGNAAYDVGTNVIKNTANKLRNTENKVPLYHGYKVFFKEVNE